VPTFNWINRLSSRHHVSLLYVKDEKNEISHRQVVENSSFVENLWVIESHRSSACIRIRDELLGRKPFFLGWSIDTTKLNQCLDGHFFDVVWGYTLSIAETIESIYNILGTGPIYVSGMSDINTAVLRSLGKRSILKGLDFKTRLVYLIFWLRSWGVGRIETKMLKIYDLILLQTDVDKKWLDKISSGKLAEKTMAISNGVNDDLFDLPIIGDGKDILFLGILNNGYGKSLEWLLNNVWPKIRKADKKIRLHVVGRGASDRLRSLMTEDNQITYTEYLQNICEIFKNKVVMLAPVFKGYGLINKVIESMAAGVPVVGDAGCFNGIPEFADGRYGIVANDADGFVKETLKLLADPMKRRYIADSARVLVKKNFSWEDRIEDIMQSIESIKPSSNL
jgi:glycosyltransferase involved in cell wall biosynthesis